MIRINLLPVRKQKQRNTAIVQLGGMVSVIVFALVGCIAWTAYYDSLIDAQKAKIAEADAEIKRLQQVIGEVNELEKQQAQLRNQLSVIDKLERGKRGPVHVLDELSTHIPKRVWVTGFQETGGKLELNGVGLENSDISEFLRSLQKSKYFVNVALGFTQSTVKNGVNIYNFKITATVNYAA